MKRFLWLFLGFFVFSWAVPTSGTSNIIAHTETSAIVYSALGATVIDNTLTVAGDNLSGAFVVISAGKQSGDSLSLSYSGFTGSYVSSTGILTITGSGTAAQYQAALRAVKFSTTTPTDPSTRTIQFILGHKYPHCFDSNGIPHVYTWTSASTVLYWGRSGYLATLVNNTERTAMTDNSGLPSAASSYITWVGASNTSVSGRLTGVIGGTVTLVNVHPGDSLSVTAGSGITGCYNKCV
jgi:hypothetical protein